MLFDIASGVVFLTQYSINDIQPVLLILIASGGEIIADDGRTDGILDFNSRQAIAFHFRHKRAD